MDKLRSRKAEVDEQLDRTAVGAPRPSRRRSRSRTRLRPARSANRSWKGSEARDRARAGPEDRRPRASPPASPETEKQSYTDRLLKAKQRVWEEREKDKEGPEKPEP